MNQAKFYWAIVGDAGPEPVAVVEEDGKQMAYTCGCPDPFEVGKHIELIPAFGRDDTSPLDLPLTPKARAALRLRREKELQALAKKRVVHMHRGFSPKVMS